MFPVLDLVEHLVIGHIQMNGGHGDMAISFGLVDPADTFLKEWNGGILGPPGVSLCHC